MNFESKNLRERDPYSEEVLTKLYQKAEKKIEPYRPNPKDFRDIYSTSVDTDMAEVARLESIYKEQSDEMDAYFRQKKEIKDKIAYIAEFIIGDQLSGEWLAGKGNCTPTSKFDDYKNGVDMVIEFPQEESPNKYLGLGIDITTSKDATDIRKKLDRILKNDVLRDSTTEIKYFESEEIKRAISVPRVIIALQDDQIKSLFTQEDRNNKQALAEHKAHLIILYQLQQQCTTFFKIAHRKDAEKAQQMYGRAQQMITEIIQEKQALFAENPTLLQDDVPTMEIWRYCTEKEAEMGVGEQASAAA
jgi:hypothetical protein